uniref:cytochrome c oxidase subunit II n=1 Tax=Ctenolepisma longicaudatum TaxID=27554 RepID=UPI002435EA92|nr:cytochrome c oxidase subunit II [Ctenolepisma longicaudatum]WEX31822.1 cytochrome c oxidase subunit II [Ctenolepisma longicaudatum]
MATWNQLGLQDAASPIMQGYLLTSDHTMLIIMMITVLVAYLLTSILFNKYTNRFMLEGQTLETIWTILPAIMLIFIALPSLRLLYLTDEINQPSITLKVIGHQWYWSYEYSDFLPTEFDSYMIPVNEMKKNNFRLLDVDNRVVLPFNTDIRILITAADVLHSWAMPAMGLKADATPGRLNQVSMNAKRIGLFFGQCSEICGANHSFMPITMEICPQQPFINWMSNMIQEA